jgi:hypothetical protein
VKIQMSTNKLWQNRIHGALGCLLAVAGFEIVGWHDIAAIIAFIGAVYCWVDQEEE